MQLLPMRDPPWTSLWLLEPLLRSSAMAARTVGALMRGSVANLLHADFALQRKELVDSRYGRGLSLFAIRRCSTPRRLVPGFLAGQRRGKHVQACRYFSRAAPSSQKS
jgi:hypothetical protein